MKHISLFFRGLIQAVIAVVYIVIVVIVMNQSHNLFASNPEIISGVLMLLLFVVSVAVMALAVFGVPVMWYIDGKKKDAIELVLYTVGEMACVLIIAFIISIFVF